MALEECRRYGVRWRGRPPICARHRPGEMTPVRALCTGSRSAARERREAAMEIPTDVDHSAPVLTDLAIDIAAPRDAVWRLHTDINAWPTWQKDITDAALQQPLAVGASFGWATYGMAEAPPADRSRWLRGLVGLGLTVVVLPLGGWDVAEARVEPPVVVGVDPGEDRPSGGGPVPEPVAVHQLPLER